MATMTAISRTTVGAGGAVSVTFSSIPNIYSDLRIVISGRSDHGAHYGGGTLRFNGDSGANYSYRRMYGDTTTVGSSSGAAQPGIVDWDVNGGTTTASIFGNTQITIPNYQSNAFKSCNIEYSVENNAAAGINGLLTGLWSSTSPITSITLYPFTYSTFYFQQYTTFTLYGIFRGPETRPSAPTIGTATAGSVSASVAFTPTSATNVDAGYTVLSTPGSITATGGTSPITITGLTAGTAYTFQVKADNPGGSSAYSSSSNSVTPTAALLPLLGAWTTAATTTPGSAGDGYYGVSLVSGEPRVFAFGGGRSATSYYNNGRGGTWTQSGADRPVGQGLGCSSKVMTNSGLFYTYGGDTGTQTLVYSTQTGGSWTSQTAVSYSAGWGDGTFFNAEDTGNYLIACGNYPDGVTASRTVVSTGGGLVSWNTATSYPVYASAPRFARLTTKAVGMGGFTSTSLSARRDNVYSYSQANNSWTSQTALPFTPSGGYIPAASVVGPADTRIYVSNGGTDLWSRGDSSGTWRSETATPNTWAQGWGITTSTGAIYLQLSNQSATYYQQLV
jgi:hypothetical protein